MNVRQKLSLAALSLILPVMASAQAPAAEAPAFAIKPYGFLGLTYGIQDGKFAYPEYAAKIENEDLESAALSVRQSRVGVNFSGADGGITGAALNARLEFDFMNPGGTAASPSLDGVGLRLRYAYATADWKVGPGKLSLLAGQTDGLVTPLHPEVGAHLALPTFMLSGNLTRRSPQIRLGYAFPAGPVTLSAELAVLNGSDDQVASNFSASNRSGLADSEARLQAVIAPMQDVKITAGFGYHMNTQTRDVGLATEEDYDVSVMGVDVNADITKYLNVRGEWFTGEGADKTYTGAFVVLDGAGDPLETTGFWVQATGKPLPFLWVMAGYGQTTADGGAGDDPKYSMLNVGVLSNVSKNWRLGLEFTQSSSENVAAEDLSGTEIALSSRFSF